MTSISQPVVPNPNSSSTSQQSAAPSHSRAASQAAGSAGNRSSHATSSRKPFSPPPASSGANPSPASPAHQHGKSGTSSPVNGKVAIPPAVPAVGTPTIVNGNTPTSSTSGSGDFGRKPSVTISASGPTQYAQNGASIGGKPPGGSGIQFGSYNPDGSPRITNATIQQAHQAPGSLGVHNPSNPRITSPANSPSPIPQPAASGGKPPSHGQNLSVSFGNSGGAESNLRPAIPSGPLMPGGQHLRRESSHSQHSDMSNHGMGPGAGRGGYPTQGGRGRGYGGPSYSQPMSYSPQPGYRQTPPNQQGNRAGMTPFQQQQQPNRPYGPPFPNSPHQAARSPVPHNAQPVPSQQGQVPMSNPQMAGYTYGHPGQYGPYGNMGPPQAYAMTGAYMNDPAYQAQNYYYFQQQFGGMPNVPPQSPRPPNQMQPSGPQGPYGAQYPPQPPPSMSRTSSAVSDAHRPGSGMGHSQPSSSTPAPSGGIAPPPSNQSNQSPAPKGASNSSFEIPKKKAASIVIRNPDSGDIVDLKKPSPSPAPSSKSPANISAAPTPPPRAPSHDSHHVRTESKSLKTDEEKRAEMKQTIAKKVEADKQEEQRKKDEALAAQQQKELDARQKQEEEEEAEAKKSQASSVPAPAEVPPKEEKSEDSATGANPTEEVEDEAAKKAREDQELEEQIAKWEAEAAEAERKEQEAEKAYAAKKQAEKDEAARKEAESFKMDEEAMKKAEREAEEAEEVRIRQAEEQEGNESQKEREEAFAQLRKGDESLTPSSETPAAQDTPQDSGIATPVSEASAAPAKAAPTGAKQKPAALKLETNKSVEPPQPTPQLLSLRSARKLTSINDVSYPPAINSPNPALNTTAPPGRFKYDREFLLQFQRAFTEKPSENWTERVKETLGDTTEPSSARQTPARGGAGTGSLGLNARQASNRAPLPQMGAFAQNVRTLPPGTTSQSRFEAANRGSRPPPQTMQNPLAGFVARPGGAFPQPPGSIKMDRVPSSTSMAHPNSPRNASQRGGSQRGSRAGGRREDPKDNKAMPLTAGAQLKPIEVTSGGWKARSVGSGAMAGPTPGGDGLMAPDVVQRKVKSNLNKMTPNNFDKISNQILEIAQQSKNETDGRSLRQVIQLTFEKATDEAHWAEMYAQFCHRMLESMSPEIKDDSIRDKKGDVVAGGHLFRKYLLTRCQTEFERGWKANLPEKPEGDTEEAAMLSDAYYTAAAAKRRGLGLVRFIGELYKLGMLTERIMHECVKKLVDYEGTPDEAEIESLTSLLKTIGQQLDNSDKGHQVMDIYFARIGQMIALPDMPSRIRFMLMDIVDLRKANWHTKSKGGVTGPTTLDAVRNQAAEAERQKEVQRMAESSRRGGGRPPIGRGDARQFSQGQQFGMPPPDFHGKTVGMDDLRRLGSKGGTRQVSSQGPTFGPTSMFNSARGSNTRKPLSIAQKDDSGASSRVSTPPAQKEKEKKEEQEAKRSTNTFGALAVEGSEAADANASPASSPPAVKSQPAIERSKSPLGKDDSSDENPPDGS